MRVWCLLALLHAPAASTLHRIAYVTNAWWPKVDGAAITAMGHARYFAQVGHPVRYLAEPRALASTRELVVTRARRCSWCGRCTRPTLPSGE